MFQFFLSGLQSDASIEQTPSADFQTSHQQAHKKQQSSLREECSGVAELAFRSRGRLISEFERYETQLLAAQEACPSSGLLNLYLDTGLELAGRAGQQNLLHLRESWLMRTWITLRNSALLPQRNEAWRSLCLIGLYQLFFVFRHLHGEGNECPRRLSLMTRDMNLLSRHLI